MPTVNIEKEFETLKEIYNRLSHAYRRGDFEKAVQLKTKNSLPPSVLSIFSGDTAPTSVRDAAVKLFKQAQGLHKAYQEEQNITPELKEQIAEYILRAQALAYEIFDYFLMKDEDVSKHFLTLTGKISKDVEAYYDEHYGFIVTPRVKETIVKQLVLGALLGVNVLYRSYRAAKHKAGVAHVDSLIEFLEVRFSGFCGRDHTAYGLLGLAYFLKGRLLLGRSHSAGADDCFRMSAENYVKKLPNKGTLVKRILGGENVEKASAQSSHVHPGTLETVEVLVGELLALRRAALALAFGSGYSALINSRVKEAISFLILARGILHFNSPSVYSSYTELLYWSAKRAEASNDARILEAAKKGVEACLKVFEAQVLNSHYPHRARIELSLVLHYLAQQHPAKRAEYYVDAIKYLKAAVEFAKGDGGTQKPNMQLYAEACYILSHLLRYQSADIVPPTAAASVAALKEAFSYAKDAEAAAEDFPRHRCEALLALCGVYTEVIKRDIPLSEVDPQSEPNDSPGKLACDNACKALTLNDGANHRISGICYLRLVDYYLKNPDTYSRAKVYWEKWVKIKDSIEHAFVKDWAVRVEGELNKMRESNLVVDFEDKVSIKEWRDRLNAAFARRKIIEFVETFHDLYQLTSKEPPKDIIRRRDPGVPGRDLLFKTDLEDHLVKELKLSKKSEVTELSRRHHLLTFATVLMRTYLE